MKIHHALVFLGLITASTGHALELHCSPTKVDKEYPKKIERAVLRTSLFNNVTYAQLTIYTNTGQAKLTPIVVGSAPLHLKGQKGFEKISVSYTTDWGSSLDAEYVKTIDSKKVYSANLMLDEKFYFTLSCWRYE